MVTPDNSEVPRQRNTVLPSLPVELRCDQRPRGFADCTVIFFVKRLTMMCVEDKLSDSVTQRTAREHVGKVVLVAGEARHANRTRNSISRDLHCGTMFVFTCDHGCDCPCLCAVTGRKRAATIKELTSFVTRQRPRALRDFFECRFGNHAVDQRFSTQQSRLSHSVVALLSADQIKARRNRPEAVNRARMTYRATRFYLAVGFEHLVARNSIGSD